MRTRLQPGPTTSESEAAGEAGRAVATWYAAHGRSFDWRSWRDDYRLLVVELLLQRTRAEVVRAFAGEFLRRYPDWHVMAVASIDDLARDLAPIGLQHRRAAAMHALAQSFEHCPSLPLEARPGIGQYVSRAVRVSRSNEVLAMVDANFVRVVRRVFAGPWMADYRYDPRLQALAHAMVVGAIDPRAVNWGVLDIGGTICRSRAPTCDECPLRRVCREAPSRAPGLTTVQRASGSIGASGARRQRDSRAVPRATKP